MDSEVVGSNASRQQGRMPRRAALKAGMALAAAGAAVRLGLPPPVARATDTWMLSVPRSDWITSGRARSSWISTMSTARTAPSSSIWGLRRTAK